MRAFVAIDIDENIRQQLEILQQQLKEKVNLRKGDCRWVNPKNIHLTLKFLGEIKDKEVVDVCNMVEKVTRKHKKFDLDIKSVGHFGGKSARVLWVGSDTGSDKLKKLQKDIENKLAHAGFPKENRIYAAHLTICRIKNKQAGIKLAQTADNYKDYDLGLIQADDVTVFQSQLTPDGPIYTVLGKYELQ